MGLSARVDPRSGSPGASISADIQLENLTCKGCEKVLPPAQVKAYYTASHPNDGPDLKEIGERLHGII
jgi:hypothetical protein